MRMGTFPYYDANSLIFYLWVAATCFMQRFRIRYAVKTIYRPEIADFGKSRQ